MLKRKLIKTAIGGLILQASALAMSAPQDLTVKSISVPSWNIITDTLISATPKLDGKRNEFLMQQVCDLARGDKTQQEVNTMLQKNNIDATKIPQQGAVFSMLVNGNLAQQQMACVSYLSSSLFYTTDSSAYFKTKVASTDKNTVKEKKNTTGDTKTLEEKSFDQVGFMEDARVKMAIAQSTGQLYAVIAKNMGADKNISVSELQKRIMSAVMNYAPEYFRTLKKFYGNNASHLQINALTQDGFAVADDNGNELIQTKNSVRLRARGVDWFGNGRILGKEYFSDVAIIASQPQENIQKSQSQNKNKNKSK
ncbi:hypothetical protein FH968_10765 [Buttiauxella sp. B2]|uniref:hypothetical protein n=1 Tax=Buttiauxella sp. B2 TaxID=2587812 RepID=UPI00111CB826|nr:hypothetical protein [Buttiauxella sp. B2]TNV20476.1 hypothetical protein FH968_10765 [Buttiauxella sp. B2]